MHLREKSERAWTVARCPGQCSHQQKRLPPAAIFLPGLQQAVRRQTQLACCAGKAACSTSLSMWSTDTVQPRRCWQQSKLNTAANKAGRASWQSGRRDGDSWNVCTADNSTPHILHSVEPATVPISPADNCSRDLVQTGSATEAAAPLFVIRESRHDSRMRNKMKNGLGNVLRQFVEGLPAQRAARRCMGAPAPDGCNFAASALFLVSAVHGRRGMLCYRPPAALAAAR